MSLNIASILTTDFSVNPMDCNRLLKWSNAPFIWASIGWPIFPTQKLMNAKSPASTMPEWDVSSLMSVLIMLCIWGSPFLFDVGYACLCDVLG